MSPVARRIVPVMALLALAWQAAEAQSPLRPAVEPPPPPGSPPQRLLAGPEYEAGKLWRTLFGDGWRHLWTTPITVPVLDLKREMGGLRPIRVGGGLQTQTIHLRGGDDGYYLFRSVNKAIRKGLAPDLQDTPAGRLVQDVMTASLHPAGGWVVPPLLEAVGVPQSRPRIFIMPDDPALGEHRAAFAGVLGQLVESPDKGESGQKRYHGSDDITDSEDLLERLARSSADRVDARSLLAARLVDLIVGDPDRNFDNFRWIAFESAGVRTWHAVPMDRDPAFIKGDGMLGWIVREAFIPKFVTFDTDYTDVAGLWASQPEVDRLLLAELDRPTWDSVVTAVQRGLTDDVIRAAVAAMPLEYQASDGSFLVSALASRRDRLPEVAARFYRDLSSEVDIQATDAAEVAEVARRGDGSLVVSLHAECQLPRLATQNQDSDPIVCLRTFYRRVFDPAETTEVRVYLRGGNDQALVHGAGPQPIQLRVIGGEGDDRLEDASRPSGESRTAFYDDSGTNQIVRGDGTRVKTGSFSPRVITDFLSEEKNEAFRDWGYKRSWKPLGDLEQSAGVVLGLRRRMTDYGFRAEPWAKQVDLSVMASVKGAVGGEARLRRRIEGSDVVISASALAAKGLWSYRFFGYGNQTPLISKSVALVPADEVKLGLDVELPLWSAGFLSLGPVYRYLWTEPDPQGPLALGGRRGAGDFGQAGVQSRLQLRRVDDEAFPRLGFELRGGASAYAPLQGRMDLFGGANGELRAYVPFLVGSGLAARVGGGVAWGKVPAHDAVFLGGRRSLRGFSTQRFAGDGALYGSGELRVPFGSLTLFTRGRVGALGFADAGRVYVGSDSPGGWHSAFGGGLWYSTMGLTGTLLYGVGEEKRLHAYFGLPF